MLYVAVSERLHLVYLRDATTVELCRQTILFACRLKIIRVMMQLQHNN